jgi:hypothetical protein
MYSYFVEATVVLTEGLSREWSSRGFGLVHTCSQRLSLHVTPAEYKKKLCILYACYFISVG